MHPDKDDTTRAAHGPDDTSWGTAGDTGPGEELCFVIVFHPDTRRIGEICSIDPTQDTLSLGREAPLFYPPKTGEGGSVGRGIADAFVSRQAAQFSRDGDEWRIARQAGRSRLQINGREQLGELILSQTVLRSGVVISLAQRVILHLRLQSRRALDRDMPACLDALIGVSPAMSQLCESAMLAAKSSDDVLLVGPTGCGKERIARAIHTLSGDSDAPWVAVNMAAMPVDLAAATLFGAQKGAYTGADRNREGCFRQACGGTLFLDEIGDTPLALQPMLLRVLQEREIQVVGGKTERVDLRVIAAMEQDPDELRESFRPALRYRLGAQEIHLPSLEKRREDIGLLAADLFRGHANARGRLWTAGESEKSISLWAKLFEQLVLYRWPGNVRELQHTIGQINSFSIDGLRVPRALRSRLAAALETQGPTPRVPEASVEVKEVPARRMVDISDAEFTAAWHRARYEVATVARDLGVSRTAIYRRLRTLRECRLAADVPLGEMLSALDACRGDLASTADRLAVSLHGLQTRLRASGVRASQAADQAEAEPPGQD